MRTGKGTPCGEFMRRYWQPAVLSAELGMDKPLAVTILGEELILFRDGDGKAALIGRYCAHQGVDMIYGRLENDGIRCMYHGWLFDNRGKVVIRGDWLPEKERRWDVGQPAYPVVERDGLILTFMGQGDAPALPEFFPQSVAHGAVEKFSREENYWRAIEQADGARYFRPNLVQSGTVTRWLVPVDDKSHTEFLFRDFDLKALAGEPLGDAGASLLGALREQTTPAASPS
jgi:phenylpropionate dioxygenase-like ring-hydroxylating dioxygenase large terminal subunit